MASDPKKKVWFPAKKYGYGWSFPNTWQGWAVFFVWLILLLGGMHLIRHRDPSGLGGAILYFYSMIIVLLVMCYLKGDSLRWRWGKKSD